MISQATFFLLFLLAIGFIAKNQSLMIAVIALLLMKLIGLDSKVFSYIQAKGINWGVTVITFAVLAPIASGEIGFKDLSFTGVANNPWLIYSDIKLKGQDPEFFNTGGVAQPIQKQFTLSIKVGL